MRPICSHTNLTPVSPPPVERPHTRPVGTRSLCFRSLTGDEVLVSQRQQMWTAALLAFVVILSLVGILMTRKAATEMEVRCHTLDIEL